MTQEDHLRRIRLWLTIFIAGLIISGITAFPLQTELSWITRTLGKGPMREVAEFSQILPWMKRVSKALSVTNAEYPFLAYGTDWLAFAHLVIAVAFVGPYIDPIRNKWVVTFGLIACAGILPLALIAGPVAEFRCHGVSLTAASEFSAPSRSCYAGTQYLFLKNNGHTTASSPIKESSIAQSPKIWI